MTDELKAAAERMRTHEASVFNQDDWPKSPYYRVPSCPTIWDKERMDDDTRALYRTYLAENPADDGDAVTEEWLRAVGEEHDLTWHGDGQRNAFSIGRVGFELCDGWAGSMLTADGFDGSEHHLCQVKTRGDVRRLLKSLGIELNEGKS